MLVSVAKESPLSSGMRLALWRQEHIYGDDLVILWKGKRSKIPRIVAELGIFNQYVLKT